MVYLELALGLVLLLAGGEFLVKGSVAVARRLGVSPLLIGLTLVGFGTSSPELVASVQAALIGAPGIAVGNIVGSNIANVLLILGASAMILPLATPRAVVRRDGTMLVVVTILLIAALLLGVVGWIIGTAFLLLLVAYTAFSYVSERRSHDDGALMHEHEAEEIVTGPGLTMSRALLMAIGGIAAVVLGADLLVDAAVHLARALGMSEAVIGLTLVAIGTSLPELVTSVMAALRGHSDVALGNVLGSNMFNSLGIMGVTAVITPVAVPEQIMAFDTWAMGASVIVLIGFAVTAHRLARWEGATLLGLYAAYLAAQLSPGLRAVIGLA